MKTENVYSEESSEEFIMARKKFLLSCRLIELTSILVVAALVGLAYTLFLWADNGGFLPPMTENDIEELVKIRVQYSISFWWNILFGAIWVAMIYWVIVSPWLRKELKRLMQRLLAVLVFVGGIYFSFLYDGLFYGLIFSTAGLALFLAFLIVPALLLELLTP